MIIPKPLLIVIEDVGWWKGSGRPEQNEPFRTGLNRMHCLEDYHALIQLARQLNTQILLGFVLVGWDTDGMLHDLPSSTWMGETWQGSGMAPNLLSRAAKLINTHGDRLCLAVHGLGHEYWEHGVLSRTEFHDADGGMRDRAEVTKHLTYYGRLLESSGIRTGFPHVFIPPALKHSFGNGAQGIQHILHDFGIRYVLTQFDKARQDTPPLTPHVTEECGVILIERGRAPVAWNHVAAEPSFSFEQPVLPLHWPNILHADFKENQSVVKSWVAFLRDGAESNGCVFLPTVDEALNQTAYYHLTRIERVSGGVVLDITQVKNVRKNTDPGACYLHIPTSANVNPKEGRLESAGHIREGLARLIPSGHTGTIPIYY